MDPVFLKKMKTRVSQYLIAALFFASPTLVLADDFKSVILAPNGVQQINVDGQHFLRIRNFTQEGGSMRGLVNVALNDQSGLSANVLAAAIVDPASAALDVINSIVISGPVTVTVTCGDATGSCFITYRKDDSD